LFTTATMVHVHLLQPATVPPNGSTSSQLSQTAAVPQPRAHGPARKTCRSSVAARISRANAHKYDPEHSLAFSAPASPTSACSLPVLDLARTARRATTRQWTLCCLTAARFRPILIYRIVLFCFNFYASCNNPLHILSRFMIILYAHARYHVWFLLGCTFIYAVFPLCFTYLQTILGHAPFSLQRAACIFNFTVAYHCLFFLHLEIKPCASYSNSRQGLFPRPVQSMNACPRTSCGNHRTAVQPVVTFCGVVALNPRHGRTRGTPLTSGTAEMTGFSSSDLAVAATLVGERYIALRICSAGANETLR